jgi:hypothetical protein
MKITYISNGQSAMPVYFDEDEEDELLQRI